MIFAAMQGDFGDPLMPFELTIYMIVPALISHFALALAGEVKNW